MTNDEALRALEKKFPDDGNGDGDAYNAGWNACRELALALLTTRQEVAPVAVIGPVWQLMWYGGDSIETIAKRHGLKIGDKLYTSTGQTSDARDGIDAEAVEEACDTLDNLIAALELPMPDHLHVAGLRASLPEVAQKVRAAMRQEGGNG